MITFTRKKIFILVGGILLSVFIVGIVFSILIAAGVTKNFRKTTSSKQPQVAIKSEYKNPFKKDTQYVNPFETYKNPFVLAK